MDNQNGCQPRPLQDIYTLILLSFGKKTEMATDRPTVHRRIAFLYLNF